jgi:hypothetical protein
MVGSDPYNHDTGQLMHHRSDLVPLCKGLRGGRGHWKGFSDLRTAIIAFDTETDKIIIPNI